MDWGQPKASHRVFKDLPALTDKAINMLRQEQTRLHACLTPITREVAMLMLGLLWTRYPTQAKPTNFSKSLIREDLEDIGEYPEQLVERACKAWRDNPENKWAPKSAAQLMKWEITEFREMKKEQERVDMLINQS